MLVVQLDETFLEHVSKAKYLQWFPRNRDLTVNCGLCHFAKELISGDIGVP
jgi:hypothetical protein